jgi:hypothetical protein
MPQMNDIYQTEINLTKKNLRGLTYPNDDTLEVMFTLDGVQVKNTLQYDSINEAREDYEMLLDMLSASAGTKQLLNEDDAGNIIIQEYIK